MTPVKRRLALTLLLCAVFWLIIQQLPGMGGSDATAKEVEIYTSSNCDACQQAKTYLYAKDIAFTEYNIDSSPNHRARFTALGGKGVPLILVKGQRMDGFDATTFEHLRQEQPPAR